MAEGGEDADVPHDVVAAVAVQLPWKPWIMSADQFTRALELELVVRIDQQASCRTRNPIITYMTGAGAGAGAGAGLLVGMWLMLCEPW